MSVNIEKIMSDIRQEIKDKGYSYNMLSFSEVTEIVADNGDGVDLNEIENNMNYLNNSYNIVSYRPLTGNKLVIFVKRVIRKLTKFYVEPIVAAQNEFNAFNVRVLNALFKNIRQQSEEQSEMDKINELMNKLDTLELQLKTVSADNDNLRKRITLLEKENSELKK